MVCYYSRGQEIIDKLHFEFQVASHLQVDLWNLDPEFSNKRAVIIVLRLNLLLKAFRFLNLEIEVSLEIQNSEFWLVLFLGHKFLHKKVTSFVLRWNSLNKIFYTYSICPNLVFGILGKQNFRFWSMQKGFLTFTFPFLVKEFYYCIQKKIVRGRYLVPRWIFWRIQLRQMKYLSRADDISSMSAD
jgi:hypothetical protein